MPGAVATLRRSSYSVDGGTFSFRHSAMDGLPAVTGKKRAAQMDGPSKKMCVLGVME